MFFQTKYRLHKSSEESLKPTDLTTSNPGTIAKALHRGRKQAFSVVSREHILSLADQAVVSGTSFLTTLLIARCSNAGQLGIYAIGISLVVFFLAFQDSLILQPYTIQRHSQDLAPADHTGAFLILSLLFSLASISVLTVAASGLLGWEGASETTVMTFIITGTLPFVLTREFARRVAIARLEMGRAILLDLTVAATQLSSLAWLGLSGRMSAISACVALGSASAVAAAGWLYWSRTELTLRTRHVPTVLEKTWALGKWLALGRVTVQVQSYITYWIAIVIAGAATTGVYATCMAIVSIINPVIFALGNVMTAKLVVAWKNGGGLGLRCEAIRNTALISATMTAFTLAVSIGGERVMHVLYGGSEYTGHGHTLTVLALAGFAAAAGMPASFALATMERPRAIVLVGIIGAISSAVFVGLLMLEWGLLGAAYGMVAGNVIGAVGRWVAFLILLPAECDSARIIPLLQSFIKLSDCSNWKITRIGAGEQAEVFMIESKSRLPTSGEHDKFIAKLYRPHQALTVYRVQAECDSLSNLHAVLDGKKINGWTILVPRPLFVCESPLAFIMTAVPGHYIDAHASKSDLLRADVLHGTARAFTDAMEHCWSTGQRHGDLGLRNVLFDIEGKKISLIDAGTRESCRTCSEIDQYPSPAVSDLAHVLCDVVRDVMGLIGSPSERMGKELFVENIFREVMKTISSPHEKRWLLDQIWSCLQAHLAECLEPSWSVKGMSHFFVKKIALNRVRSMFKRISDNNIYAWGSNPEFHRFVQPR